MKTYTFICGCGHTGTTLLTIMFAAHPDTFVPLYETEIFRKAEPRKHWNQLLRDVNSSEKNHLIEKTPKHIHNLKTIRQIVPDARFILMTRDGRDVAASCITRFGSAKYGTDRWIDENQIVRKALQQNDTILVRYEDLIEDPKSTLQRLCEFCKIPYSEEMLNFHQHKTRWHGIDEPLREGTGARGYEHRMLRAWQVNQPLFDSRGKWKGMLSDKELVTFNDGPASELMKFFGYTE